MWRPDEPTDFPDLFLPNALAFTGFAILGQQHVAKLAKASDDVIGGFESDQGQKKVLLPSKSKGVAQTKKVRK